MSNNALIPYSFTPGAKAKAQEVNANFIALAEKIEENRQYTTTQIAETVEQIEEATAESETKKADKNLGNTNLITNCILEQPNGVVTVSENVITVKSGLKVLIPDGFNDDGTVKNIVYEVEEDTSVTTVANSEVNCIYVTPDGCFYATAYYTFEKDPTTKQGIWYKHSENKMYLYKADTQTWDEISAIVVALYSNTADTVTILETAKPVRLLNYGDKYSIINWAMPVYAAPAGRSRGYTYTATRAGYLYVFGVSQGNQWEHATINDTQYRLNWVNNGSQAGNTTMFPLRRGDTYYVNGNFFLEAIYFIPMEGDM